jgi:hypothetical protein
MWEQLLDQKEMTEMVCCHGELNAVLRQDTVRLHQPRVAYQDIEPLSLTGSTAVALGKLLTETLDRSQ